ncbi:MAG: DUF1488 domain-containing protein [Phreatobacter sp.]
MAISFPNASRSFDAARRSISFWGYDSTFEFTFHIGEDALRSLNPDIRGDETSMLGVFDAHRGRIQAAAGVVYGRGRQSSYHLAASDI